MKLVLLVCLILSINSEVSNCLDYYHYPQYNTESSEETDNYRENAQEPEIDNVRDICADEPAIKDSTASWTMGALDNEKPFAQPIYQPSSLVFSSYTLRRLNRPITWKKFYFYVDINMPDFMLGDIISAMEIMKFFLPEPCVTIRQLNKFMDLYNYYAGYGAIFFYSKNGECSSYLGQTGTVGPLNSIHEIHLSSRCAETHTIYSYVFRAFGFLRDGHDSEATRDKFYPPCWSNFYPPTNRDQDILRDLYNCKKCPGDRSARHSDIVKDCLTPKPPSERQKECRRLNEEIGKVPPNSREYFEILAKILKACLSVQL